MPLNAFGHHAINEVDGSLTWSVWIRSGRAINLRLTGGQHVHGMSAQIKPESAEWGADS